MAYDTATTTTPDTTPGEHLSGKRDDEDDVGGYWSTDDEVLEDVQERRNCAAGKQDEWRDSADEAYSFVAGNQWSEEDKAYSEDVLKRPQVTFNRVGPIVNANLAHDHGFFVGNHPRDLTAEIQDLRRILDRAARPSATHATA